MRLSGFGVFCALLVGGCGDSGGGGSNTFESSFDGETVIQDLTPAEQETFCGELDEFTSEASFSRSVCEFFAVIEAIDGFIDIESPTDEMLQTACSDEFDACVNEGGFTEEFECEPENFASCSATIHQFEACANDALALFLDIADMLPSCSSITFADLESLENFEDDAPASCEVIDESCGSDDSASAPAE